MTDLIETVIENREMVQPNHANMLETAHGGHVMKWMDEVGAMSAMRFRGDLRHRPRRSDELRAVYRRRRHGVHHRLRL